MDQESVNATAEEEGEGYDAPKPVLFIFVACAMGALVRTILKKVNIGLPYTVMVLILGLIFGSISKRIDPVANYTSMVDMNPHVLLHVFLPILIFESAFAMHAHTFFKCIVQIMLLAIPGLLLAAVMTAIYSRYVFPYHWGWDVSLLFGAIISATDPVAVVALLKEMGVSRNLATVIEGESLLNDGAAIVLFNCFLSFALPNEHQDGLSLFLYILRVSIGSPLFGYIYARITTWWLVNIYNDAVTEITITLASTYITFFTEYTLIEEEFVFIVEAWFEMSGVVAVVILGVTLSSEKTCVSPEVETFLHRFWEMLAYLANTLIFMMVGVLIAEKASDNLFFTDWVLLLSLYCALNVIRGVTIAMLSPLLKRIGYGLSWKEATVMTWGGLRGAVGLALALIVSRHDELDETLEVQDQVLFQTAGIVMLTLLVNATTMKKVLDMLGMTKISAPKRMAMASAVRNLQDVINTSVHLYKSDRFLADADWDSVLQYVQIKDPYKTSKEEADLELLGYFQRSTTCPACEVDVLNEPSPKEWLEMKQEARMRLLKAKKTSYWKQYEHGMVSRDAVRRLVECVDTLADDKDAFSNTDEIKKNWDINPHLLRLKRRLERIDTGVHFGNVLPEPKGRLCKFCYRLATHKYFDVVIYLAIFFNVLAVVAEIAAENSMTCEEFKERYGFDFQAVSLTFLAIYTLEAVIKLLAFKSAYFKSRWNIFDFFILLLCYVDMIVELTIFEGTKDCQASGLINPNILRAARMIRLFRLIRTLRLCKMVIPTTINHINHRINEQLRFGYDVGKGYITGDEEIEGYVDIMVDNKRLATSFRDELQSSKAIIMRELGILQRTTPGIAVSIKTQQASRRILNNTRDRILQLKADGLLDEDESEKLETMIEVRMKKLLGIPPKIQPPSTEKILCNLAWVSGDSMLIDYITHNAVLVSLQEGQTLDADKDPHGGIYIIINGLIQVDKYVMDNILDDETIETLVMSGIPREKLEPLSTRHKFGQGVEKITDFMSTGSVLGEMSLLTGKPSHVEVTCSTSVQMYHIPYEGVQAAIELFIDDPTLEYRLWRMCAIRIATAILSRVHYFRKWTPEDIKMHLEKSALYLKKWEFPEGGVQEDVPMFDIRNRQSADIVLIHGVCEIGSTGDLLVGPCYIPNEVEHLLLLPGKTENHVILVMPRDPTALTGLGDSDNMDKLKRMGARESQANLVMMHQLQEQLKASKFYFHQVNETANALMYPVHDVQELLAGCKCVPSSMCLHHATQMRNRLTEKVKEQELEKRKNAHGLRMAVSSLLHLTTNEEDDSMKDLNEVILEPSEESSTAFV